MISPKITSYTLIPARKNKNKKRLLISVFVVLIAFITSALFLYKSPSVNAAVVYDATRTIGGAGNDVSNAVATDSSGNVYFSGGYAGTVDFDPGAGTTNLTAVGNHDIFITKFDSSGNLVWADSFGGTVEEYSYGLTVDSSGNVYATGYFEDTVDFDPGAGTFNLTASGATDDIYVVKLDSSGALVWAKAMSGTNYEYGYAIKVDTSGNVYTTGEFAGTVDFDPGAGTANLTSAGNTDIFISKLDSSGNFVWADKVGAAGQDNSYGLALDSSANVFITGRYSNTVDFDPGAGTANLTSAGSGDIYVLKLASDGTYVWAKGVGDTFNDNGQAIAVDTSGNVYSTGTFFNTVDFDPGAGTANLTSAGTGDIYVWKLDSNGNYIWAEGMGGTGGDVGLGIAVDSSGGVYTTGTFRNTADFDPGAGTTNFTAVGNIDAFISKLDSSGNFIWAQGFGGSGFDTSAGIALDNSNNVYTTGTFQTTVDFDPSAGTDNKTVAGGQDIFLTESSQTDVPTVTTAAASNIAATSATLNGNITSTGNLTITDRGFDYGLTTSYSDQTGESGSFGAGAFTSDISGLTCGTTYHFRAFATNSAGTSTGSDNTFTTSGCPTGNGTFFPGDGTHPAETPPSNSVTPPTNTTTPPDTTQTPVVSPDATSTTPPTSVPNPSTPKELPRTGIDYFLPIRVLYRFLSSIL